jgi:hypothetical protein
VSAVQAPGFIRAVHPEHGEPVVFTPGEQLPAWVADAVESGAELVAVTGEENVLELRHSGRKGGKR